MKAVVVALACDNGSGRLRWDTHDQSCVARRRVRGLAFVIDIAEMLKKMQHIIFAYNGLPWGYCLVTYIFAARCYASAAYAVMQCVSVCLSVCLCVSVSFVHSVKTNKHIFNFFHHRVGTPFQFSCTKQYGNIPTGTPLTGASNAGRVGRNRDSEPISGLTACC